MSGSTRKSVGTDYTATAALVVAAVFFSPAAILASGPPSYGSISTASVFSVICLAFAWLTWTRSQLTITSIPHTGTRSR